MPQKTVQQHFESITDPVLRKMALRDMDVRYKDELCYTLACALTFGVWYKTEKWDNTALWTNVINSLVRKNNSTNG